MTIEVYNYNAVGVDQQVDLATVSSKSFGKNKLLWIDVCGEEAAALKLIAKKLGAKLAEAFDAGTKAKDNTPQNYGGFLRFAVDTPPRARFLEIDANDEEQYHAAQEACRVIFYLSESWLVTVHDTEVDFITDFRDQDKGETLIGLLTPAALTASLLDWYLGDYFDAVSLIAESVDALDERVLRETTSRSLLGRIVALRRRTARLREFLARSRVAFYGLARPDLLLIAGSESATSYQNLIARFERALDELERARDLINGSFDLFSSRSSIQTNTLVKVLTIVTAVLGYIGATAGLFGMNLKSSLFNGGDGTFAIIVVTLFTTSIGAILYARNRRWI